MLSYLYYLFGYFWGKKEEKEEPKPEMLGLEHFYKDENIIESEIVEGESYECMKPNPQFDVCIEELSAFLEGIKSHCMIEESDNEEELMFNIDDLLEQTLEPSVD